MDVSKLNSAGSVAVSTKATSTSVIANPNLQTRNQYNMVLNDCTNRALVSFGVKRGQKYFGKSDIQGLPKIHLMSAEELQKMGRELKNRPDILYRILTQKDSAGMIPVVRYDKRQLEAMKDAFNNKHFLNMLYSHKDNYGNIPIFTFDGEQTNVMLKSLSPKVLDKIYLTKNKYGEIPAHWMKPEALAIMNKLYANNPEMLKKVYLSENCFGDIPAQCMKAENLETMKEGLKNYPKILEKIEAKLNEEV